MSKPYRWYGLKHNGTLVEIHRSKEPMTIKDLEESYDTFLVKGRYDLVEVSVKQVGSKVFDTELVL